MMPAQIPLFVIDRYTIQDGASVLLDGCLQIVTPEDCWAYAVSFLPTVDPEDIRGMWVVNMELQVARGQVGIGILTDDGKAFIKESLVPSGEETVSVVLRVRSGVSIGPLVVRNAGSSEAHVTIQALKCTKEKRLPYLVDVVNRQPGLELRPSDGGTRVFDDRNATDFNKARMDWLHLLGLDFSNKRILDVGAGVGYFSRFFADQGATVVALEGRPENIAILRERHPNIETQLADIQSDDLTPLGRFNIVHCFGLLYHLDSPVNALRKMHSVCEDVLLLETMVCDADIPIAVLTDEPGTVNQALTGLGCRPSPAFIVTALNRIGFRYVYGTNAPPLHPDFQFEWQNQGGIARDGHNLRCVFLASRVPFSSSILVLLT